jgi:4a-hydroxytetrahydrobiopterin dehydratase
MALLNKTEINHLVSEKKLTDWQISEKEINRQFVLNDFRQAMDFVNKVADAAEEADHHPDIKIEWNKVSFTLSTHTAGGITKKDLNLAEKINGLSNL